MTVRPFVAAFMSPSHPWLICTAQIAVRFFAILSSSAFFFYDYQTLMNISIGDCFVAEMPANEMLCKKIDQSQCEISGKVQLEEVIVF